MRVDLIVEQVSFTSFLQYRILRFKVNISAKSHRLLLLLRGAQTPGELRTRTNRLADFSDVKEVESILENMASVMSPLVVNCQERQANESLVICIYLAVKSILTLLLHFLPL